MASHLAPHCTDQALLQLIDRTLVQIQEYTASTVELQELGERRGAVTCDQVADRYISEYGKLVVEQSKRKLDFTELQLSGPGSLTTPRRYTPRH